MKEENKQLKTPMSPIGWFFKLGEKVTKGDPERQQDFTYYMLWILFSAFAMMFVTNLIRVINGDWYSLIWMLVGFAIMSLQFFSLKAMYDMKQLRKNPQPEEKVESIKEMLNSFSGEEEVMK